MSANPAPEGNPGPDFRRLLLSSLAAALLGAAMVTLCYFYVDRPVAFFVHQSGVSKFEAFRLLTLPPPIAQRCSPLALAALLVLRAFRPWKRWQLALFVSCVSLIIADQCRQSLGEAFGRYWPQTWHDDNPSLIGTGTYGFDPFPAGGDVGSFPSGHAARIAGFAGVWWIAYPKSRIAWVLVCLPMLASLVAMNYHFVGDILAGILLGALVAAYSAALAVIHPTPDQSAIHYSGVT